MMHMFPDLFAKHRVAPVEHYPEHLLQDAGERRAARPASGEPTIALLTPGHLQLAPTSSTRSSPTRWASSSSRGSDLFVEDGCAVHEHDAGPAPDRRRLPAHRRRLSGSAHLQAGFGARRAGPVRSLSRRPRDASSTRRAAASPTTRRSTPTSPRSSNSTPASAPILQNVPTYIAATRTSSTMCWTICRSWS